MTTRSSLLKLIVNLSLLLSALIVSASALSAPSKDLWPFWDSSNESSVEQIGHSEWAVLLDTYLISGHPSGVSRFDYAAVNEEHKALLVNYLEKLQSLDPRSLNRAEQKAYWFNFYNALTVKVILDDYPVESIRDIGGGFFSRGPWDKKLATVAGKELTLNDIEHRILRPIWNDPRIHFAVNCASIGCPNLMRKPFTASNTEQLLQQAASDFIQHPRGVSLEGSRLTLSKIFDWYQADFGENEAEMLGAISAYAEPALAAKLRSFDGKIFYQYDWALNAP